MSSRIDKSKGPGVYVPPPIFYVLVFFISVFIQNKIPLPDTFFYQPIVGIIGALLIIVALFFLGKSLRQFFQTKNTVVLIKPASSLQTTGIYALTRNPMYVGLALIYLGMACFVGNWWTFILFPFVILIIQEYVIKREEKYLELEFGQDFRAYKNAVRRWL